MISRLMVNVQSPRSATAPGSRSIPSISARGADTMEFRSDTQTVLSTSDPRQNDTRV